MFRIKFKWSEADGAGKTVRMKREVIAECSSYTDAEALALEIMRLDNIVEDSEYEIVKEKISANDIFISPSTIDSENEVNSLVELFFIDEKSKMYQIKLEFDSLDERPTAHICYVLSHSTRDAIDWLKKVMWAEGMGNYSIKKTSDDNMEMLYLNEPSYERIIAKTSEIEDGLQD